MVGLTSMISKPKPRRLTGGNWRAVLIFITLATIYLMLLSMDAFATKDFDLKVSTTALVERRLQLSNPESCSVNPAISNAFNRIYEKGLWGPSLPSDPSYYYSYGKMDIRDRKSASGAGSNVGCMTSNVLAFLSQVIRQKNITSMFDIPCGDVNWQFESWEIDALNSYVGADVSSDVITLNKRRFAHRDNMMFVEWDLSTCDVPSLSTGPFDLIHVRDVLQHLSLEQAKLAADRLWASKARYLVTTTYPKSKSNRNIDTGEFFMNNLALEPFNFPPPMKCVKSHIAGCNSYEEDITCLYDLTEKRLKAE